MKNSYLTLSLLTVGLLASGCVPDNAGASFSQASEIRESYITESYITESIIGESIIEESIIEESVIEESIIEEEVVEETTSEEAIEVDDDFDWGIFPYAYDIMRSPTEDELALAPSLTLSPGRFDCGESCSLNEPEIYRADFSAMDEESFNGFEIRNVSDPENRGYAVIIYMNDTFYMSSGIGLGMTGWSGYTSDFEWSQEVLDVDVYINYSISNNMTLDVNDIVTLHVSSFQFQYVYLTTEL
jgi:hypothetical protein